MAAEDIPVIGGEGWEPYTLAEISAGGWRDVSDGEWELAKRAEAAHPDDENAQREWIRAAAIEARANHAR